MSKTSFIAAALVVAALATPTAAAFEVFDDLWIADDGSQAQAGPVGVYLWESHEEDPESSEPAPEESSDEDSDGSSASVSLLGVVSVSAPLPIEAPLVPLATGLLDTLPLDVVDIVEDVVPAPAPAPASAPVARASEPTPAFVPLIVPDEPSVPAAAVAAGAVTVAAAGAASTGASLWERLRRVGLLALLYSRIAKERLLDHGSRERLLETIRARPGLAVADLSDVTGIPRNTVTYHLRVLERESLVSSQRQGRNRLFFAPGSLPQRANADAIATLRHETTLKMAQAIGASPGLDQKALCAQVGVSPSLAHWHADRLVASGVVDKKREGRFVRYYPGTAFTIVASRS